MESSAGSITGRVLGDFTIGDKLGEGGHGVVYRATQRVLGRPAVIKILRARRPTDETAIARFLREAQLASRLDHPFAAHIYAFGAEPDGLLWIAMELVRGTTLRAVLASQPGGRLPVVRAVPLIEHLCEVVHTAHEQGIVHRDVKPENVMVVARAGRWLPKLLDLGIAKPIADAAPDAAPAAGELAAAAATHTGPVVGSPHYMAPEQWIAAGDSDARTDQYALGVIAFELLTGRPPFTAPTIAALADQHLRADPPALPDDVPGEVAAVIGRALAKRPDDRFAHALAFAAALRDAAGLGLTADVLPRLDAELRGELAWFPPPIADAAAALEAAHSPHQARAALWATVRAAVRWLGVLALCARSRSPIAAPPAERLRALHDGDLALADWLALVEDLVLPFAAVRDAYPVPELVDLVLAAPSPFAALLASEAAAAGVAGEAAVREQLAACLPAFAACLRALGFLTAYPVVVGRGDGVGEVWMGPRRGPRARIAIAGELAVGAPAIVDLDGRPVLGLAPLVQVAPPTPDARDELFVFAGAGRVRARGARLVAEPHGFEHHDDTVWPWFAAALLAVDEPTAPVRERTPYRGLAAFTEDDAAWFFGREREIAAFCNRLHDQPLAVVVGPSGAGKSSFVRAGVIPALPAAWRVDVIRPGAAPLAALARCAPPAADTDAVLVIDQLEELFTLGADREELAAFAAAIVARMAAGRVRVVLVVRDDFLARTGELPALRHRLARAVTLLASPGDDDLARALVEPARRAGYQLDAGLAARMVGAVSGQPGALALLSFAALRLWELRDRHFRRLTTAAYTAIGGVEGALARHAEATYHACRADDRPRLREAFRHLITAEATRAQLTRDELADLLGGADAARAVIDALIGARLVVVRDGEHGAQIVEIIHEALIAAWPRLVGWRRDDAEGARLRDQLRAAAQQWHDRGRPRGLLWRDDALDDYVRWRARWPSPLPALDRAFADASLGAAARGRRARRLVAGLAAGVVIAGVIGLGALYRASRASAAAARVALTESWIDEGQRALFAGDYPAALPLFARAFAAGDRSLAVRRLLHRALTWADQPRAHLHGQVADAVFRARRPDVLALGLDGDAAIIDAATGAITAALPAEPGAGAHPVAGALSRDGALAAVVHDRAVVLWDGAHARTLVGPGELDPRTTRLALDPSGARLALAARGRLEAWRLADAARLWSFAIDDARQLAWLGDGVAARDRHGALWLADAAGARALGAADRVIGLGDHAAVVRGTRVDVLAVTGDLVQPFALAGVTAAALAGDGHRIALGTRSGVVELADLATGQRTGVLVGHTASVLAIAFARDGARIVTAGGDHSVRVWDGARGRELARFTGFEGSALDLAIAADDAHVVVTCADDVRVYPLDDPAALRVIDAGEPVGAAQLLDDGRQVLVSTESAVARFDTRTGARLATIAVSPFDGAHASPDRQLVAVPLADGHAAELRALGDGRLRARLVSDAQITWAVFDPAGARVATANTAGAIELWALDGARLARWQGHATVVESVAFSPDGSRLVSASNDRSARVWDAATGREIVRVHHADEIDDARFDPTGARIVTAGEDRALRVWDAATGIPVATLGHAANVRSAAIDGAQIAGATAAGEIELWDAASLRKVGQLRHADRVMAVELAGARLLSTGLDGRIMVWDVGAEPANDDVLPRVCRVLRDRLGRVAPDLACSTE